MGTKVAMRKVPGGWVPATAVDAAALDRFKVGEQMHGEFTKQRNPDFHRKFFAMLGVGFDAFEPAARTFRGLPVQKNLERFRKDCICAAGFYDPVANLNGEVRAEAKSISFGSMDDIEFEGVYSAVADVLLQRVLSNYTREDLERVVQEILAFT